ncbi:MAG: hypothetical protein V1898_03220 [Patescibacteria group bacterium]
MTNQDSFQQIKQIADTNFYTGDPDKALIRNCHQLIRRTFEQDVPNALQKWQRGDETTLYTHGEIKPLIIQARTLALQRADGTISKEAINEAYKEIMKIISALENNQGENYYERLTKERVIEIYNESRPEPIDTTQSIHISEDEESVDSNGTIDLTSDRDRADSRNLFERISNR